MAKVMEEIQASFAGAERRGRMVGLTGLLIQSSLFALVLVAGLWTGIGSDAVSASARHLGGGLAIWLILTVVFAQRQRSRLEDLDTEQLRRAQQKGLATSIFDVGDEAMLLHRRRLNWTIRFLLPAFTVLTAAYLIGGTFLWWRWPLGAVPADEHAWQRTQNPFVPMLLMAGVGVVSFAYARYVVGLSRHAPWRLLRAGGSYLLGCSLTAVAVAAAMALARIETTRLWAEPVAAYAIRAGMLLLGVEILLNFILDFYRPRRVGEDIRPAFDSRVLALVGEPGGVVRSIAETINYQFGFEVSSTWFYKLVQRSVFPLVVLTAVVLMLLTSVVVVDVDERAYVERFGRLLATSGGDPLGPGLHFKWFWPIDRVERGRVDLVRTMSIGGGHEGEESGDDEEEAEDDGHGHGHDGGKDHGREAHDDLSAAILWTEQHEFANEMLTVVANPGGGAVTLDEGAPAGGRVRRSRSVSVSLLMLAVEIQYRIRDLHAYAYRYVEPGRVLESIAYQELATYAAGVGAAELMGRGRQEFSRTMRERLQRRCDEELDLGVEITFVALQDAHPPAESEVAATYQKVIAAEIEKAATMEKAIGDADRMLTLTAGDVRRARELDGAILRRQELMAEATRSGTPEAQAAADEAARQVEAMLTGDASKGMPPPSGDVSTILAGARAERSAAISDAESKVQSFRNDLAAYEAAPELFRVRKYLGMLQRYLPGKRKFVVAGEAGAESLVIEYETKKRTTLDLDTAALE